MKAIRAKVRPQALDDSHCASYLWHAANFFRLLPSFHGTLEEQRENNRHVAQVLLCARRDSRAVRRSSSGPCDAGCIRPSGAVFTAGRCVRVETREAISLQLGAAPTGAARLR